MPSFSETNFSALDLREEVCIDLEAVLYNDMDLVIISRQDRHGDGSDWERYPVNA